MSRPDAFYLPPPAFAAPYVLTGGEANHCVRVLRKRPGEVVRLFDGLGHEGFSPSPRHRDRVTLCSHFVGGGAHAGDTAPSGRRLFPLGPRDMFLEKAVELGAAGVFFWQAARTQGRMPEAPKDAWTTACISAAKQCGRGQAAGHRRRGRRRGRAGLPGRSLRPALSAVGSSRRAPATATGGCDRPRRRPVRPRAGRGAGRRRGGCLREAGFVPVSLGHRVLRWETAGLAVLALGLALAPPEKTSRTSVRDTAIEGSHGPFRH